MRKLGLIGGLSWFSTARYYEIINRNVNRALGGFHSAPLVIESLDFAEVARCTSADDWDCAASQVTGAAMRIEAAGAEALLICANSMHKVYDQVQSSISIPIIHIADVVGAKMQADGIRTATLIGTRNVMTEKFYRQKLVSHGVSLTPPSADRASEIDRIIYEELMVGKASRDSERTMKTYFTDISKGETQAIVLACTELEMIVDVKANVLPIYDSTRLHAQAGADFILG